MQCQMHRQNKMLVPDATVPESNNFFYSKGREAWITNPDFRDDLED
jgi:hypothetical protein